MHRPAGGPLSPSYRTITRRPAAVAPDFSATGLYSTRSRRTPSELQAEAKPITDSHLPPLIAAALEHADLRVDPRAQEQLSAWLDALLRQPRNLTGVTEPVAAIAKHIIEPLAGFNAVVGADIAVPHGPIIDIGSGNGAPGLPIALTQPDREMTLLDSRETSIEFLDGLPELLGMPNLRIYHGRAEQAADLRERFAVVLTRATAPPRMALELAIPMLALGGVMILYARVPDDPAELAATAHTLGAELMPLGPQPELIAAVKTAPTPDRYPRSWAQIKRRAPAPS